MAKRVGKPQVSARSGFTLIELLVVIVIIAILAAITIIAYRGITDRARVSTIQSELSQNAKLAQTYSAVNGAFPANLASGGFKASGGTLTYNVAADGTAFCLQEVNGTLSYYITNDSGQPVEGHCSGTTGQSGPPVANDDHDSATSYAVTTYAGVSGASGEADGDGTAARFYAPAGLVVDNSGSLFLAEAGSGCIRKITPTTGNVGHVTTYVGICGTSGNANGTGTAASLNAPIGLALANDGASMYVIEELNSCVRTVTPSGGYGTVASFAAVCQAPSDNSQFGYQDGSGDAAKFYAPASGAVDGAGNLYVTDAYNNCIRKITPARVVNTFAGTCGTGTTGTSDGTGSAARFNQPFGIGIDSAGDMFVSDGLNHCVRKITATAVVSTFAGTCGSSTAGTSDGTGAAAQFSAPAGIAVSPAGVIYVPDETANCIRKISPSAVVTTIAGTCGAAAGSTDGTSTAAQFNNPGFLALGQNGVLYVSEFLGDTIRKLTPQN